jgi:hypothetical protein
MVQRGWNRSIAAARPTFLRTVVIGTAFASVFTSFAALGFFCVFCLDDMMPNLSLYFGRIPSFLETNKKNSAKTNAMKAN